MSANLASSEGNIEKCDLENSSIDIDLVSGSGAGVAISVIETTVFRYVLRTVLIFALFKR